MLTSRQGPNFRRSISSIGICVLLGVASFLGAATTARAQATSIVGSFDNTLGNDPTALITATDGNLYGTTYAGGTSGQGVVYQFSSVLSAAVILHNFGDGTVAHDGATPTAGLVEIQPASSGTSQQTPAPLQFFGTTTDGGTAGKGVIYSVTSTKQYAILHDFGSVAGDGATPLSGLIEGADGNLYGTTSEGGTSMVGTVFRITPVGGMTILHSFRDGSIVYDGYTPGDGLVQDAQGNLYGVTAKGGTSDQGTVFKINPQGQYSVLYNFTPNSTVSFSPGSSITRGAGIFTPNSRLVLGADGNLYGIAAGSSLGFGAVYRITPAGVVTVLHYFGDGSVANDGQESGSVPLPVDNALAQGSDGNFYGTTALGGKIGQGTVFEMTPTGQETILHSFGDGTVPSDGTTPQTGVVFGSDGNLYGTTNTGGAVGLQINEGNNTIGNMNDGALSTYGTIFKVVLASPQITSLLTVNAGLGLPFTYQVTATKNPTSFSAPNLPAGLSIDSSTGIISGTPTAVGTTSVNLVVTDAQGDSGASQLILNVVPPPVITSILTTFCSPGFVFDYQIIATGPATSYSATGLPAGLTLNPITGIISGTPTVTGTFPVTISASNVDGTDTQTLSVIISATPVSYAQEYVQLHSFNDGSVAGEGVYPGQLIEGSDTFLYGPAASGGTATSETVFRAAPSGSTGVAASLGSAGGSTPQGLVQGSDGNFYGTTPDGGSTGKGTLFQVTPAGVVTLLHTFGDGTVTNDGANPKGALVQDSSGKLYGTTQFGGSANKGTIFSVGVNPTQAGFVTQASVTTIHSFGDGTVVNDGAQPVAGMVIDPATGYMYGTTLRGGVFTSSSSGNLNLGTQTTDSGTVFRVVRAAQVTTIHCFNDGTVANDGQLPSAPVSIEAGGTGYLYGTTVGGGTADKGTVFIIPTGGTEWVVHNFGDGSVTNDGESPVSPVTVIATGAGVQIFGTTPSGGSAGFGTVFQVTEPVLPIGTGTTVILHHFGDGSVVNDGQIPMSGLTLDRSGNLYGTTIAGGAGSGTLYAFSTNLMPLPLTLVAVPETWQISGTLPPGLTFDSTTGAITGTPLAGDSPGLYSVSITYPNLTTSRQQTYAVTETFTQWATAKAMPNLVGATTGGDGVPNTLKYLFDIPPNAPMKPSDHAAMPTLEVDDTTVPGTPYVALTFRQNPLLSGMDLTLESSDDLVNWSPVDPDTVISKQTGTDSVTHDPIMEMGTPADGSAHQFLRLQVTPQ